MNRVLIFNHDPCQKTISITDEKTIAHCLEVLKIKPKDELKATLVGTALITGKVTQASPKLITLEILTQEAGLKLPYHLQVAASRPPTMKKILEHSTSMGVAKFDIFKGHLSDKSYLQSHIYKQDKLHELLSLGLSQGKSFTHLPQVTVQDKRPLPSHHQKYFLSLRGRDTFSSINIDFTQQVTVAIGPERGWTEQEEQELTDQGYHPIYLASGTLRVEIATFAALGQLEMLRLKE